MMARTLIAFLLAALPVEGPFAGLDYNAALDRAQEQQKLLFVDFTATWCGPCKKMDTDTWQNAEVMGWLGEHAVAIQVDVDKQQSIARQFRVKAMPTVVVMRGGEEFDRFVGYKGAEDFLVWARDVAAGKRSTDELMKRAERLAESEDVDARYELAGDLLQAERYDLALDHYLWLWPATREVPRMGGVRLSFMLGDIGGLMREHPPAAQAFREVLDGLQVQVDAEGVPEYTTWAEWSALCKLFREKDRIVAWYERRRDADGGLFKEQSGQFLVQHITDQVIETLIQEDRLVDAVRLIGDSRAYATRVISSFEQLSASNERMDEEHRVEMDQFARNQLSVDISKVYAALLAVGRADDAAEVEGLLVGTLDTPQSRMALVGAALRVVKEPPQSLKRLLDEAEGQGGNVRMLRRRLERLVKAARAPAETSQD